MADPVMPPDDARQDVASTRAALEETVAALRSQLNLRTLGEYTNLALREAANHAVARAGKAARANRGAIAKFTVCVSAVIIAKSVIKRVYHRQTEKNDEKKD